MNSVKCDKIYIFAVYAAEFIMGIYIASVRLYNASFSSAKETFIAARETDYIDLMSNMFDVQVFISVLPLIISISLSCGVFSRNYIVKCYYAATRQRKYIRFYFGEIFSLAKYCVVSEFLYSTGMLLYALYASASLVFDKEFLFAFLLSILNSSIILYIFVLIGAVMSVLINNKFGFVLSVTISLICTALLFALPVKTIQFDIMSWFFLSEFPKNSAIFTYSIACYYVVAVIVIIFIACLGGILLKKKDILKE